MAVQLVHCSYHKCLTVYFKRVMDAVFNRYVPWSGGYAHHNSDFDAFIKNCGRYRLVSVNNHAISRELLGGMRVTRFIRDPRDLLVSGYFYHRRGAEAWCTDPAPDEADWAKANVCLPPGLKAHGGSFADYLQAIPKEEGLLAELAYRRRHFESMAAWPKAQENVLLLRYEDFPGQEVQAFDRIFQHYQLGTPYRQLGCYFAARYSLARRQKKDAHIRNPASGQWREHFTPRVQAAFDREWSELIRQLDYPVS